LSYIKNKILKIELSARYSPVHFQSLHEQKRHVKFGVLRFSELWRTATVQKNEDLNRASAKA